MDFIIREICRDDDKTVENIIRSCLIEFGANRAGTAWEDPDLCRFSEIYTYKGAKYWVAEIEGRVIGGVGIGFLTKNTCELQKMYCLPEARGTGIAPALLDTALKYAKEHYRFCFLETLDNMHSAQRFYEKHGFKRTERSPVKTPHFACEVKYIKELI